jgi:pyruvate formate lyase activating enzyme
MNASAARPFRENLGGTLHTLVFNRPCAIQVDPVEKEPLYHFLPGKLQLSLSTASCNYRCLFCHNWHISHSAPEDMSSPPVTAGEIVSLARTYGCSIVSHTYGEPTVHFEYLLDVGEQARKEGLKVIHHTNLGMNPYPLEEILALVDALSIDLKGFDAAYYRRMCRADLGRVLENLLLVKSSGIHFELVNLVLPALNEDPGQVDRMCCWIRDNLGEDTPLHFSRYYPTQLFTEIEATPIGTLERCQGIAMDCGLHFVFIGNVPGHKANSTYCPNCGKPLIVRFQFTVLADRLDGGCCPDCGSVIPGVWE